MTPETTTAAETTATPAITSAPETIRESVRDHYARAALSAGAGTAACCGDDCCGPSTSSYSPLDLIALPAGAVAASLGCGNPFAVADLEVGERVLDLGAGGGIDVLLSAQRVGPSGFVYGLDMTDEMLDLARRHAGEAGVDNVEFLKGQIEAIPLPDDSVDVVISNCVVNLSTDKPAVFREIVRVLRPGGRIGISDIVAGDALTPSERAERGSYVGCIAGALSFAEVRAIAGAAGLVDISVTPTHEVAEGMHSALIRGSRSAG